MCQGLLQLPPPSVTGCTFSAASPPRCAVLECTHVCSIDYTVVLGLEELLGDFHRQGVTLAFVGLQVGVRTGRPGQGFVHSQTWCVAVLSFCQVPRSSLTCRRSHCKDAGPSCSLTQHLAPELTQNCYILACVQNCVLCALESNCVKCIPVLAEQGGDHQPAGCCGGTPPRPRTSDFSAPQVPVLRVLLSADLKGVQYFSTLEEAGRCRQRVI